MIMTHINTNPSEEDQGGFPSQSDRVVLDYLNTLAVIQDDGIHKRLQKELICAYVSLEKRADGLLKNTLPEPVAEEIKETGRFLPRSYDSSILFTDLAGFTRLAARTMGKKLIELLDCLFRGIDDLVARFQGTKIKTIGDACLAVFGAPLPYPERGDGD